MYVKRGLLYPVGINLHDLCVCVYIYTRILYKVNTASDKHSINVDPEECQHIGVDIVPHPSGLV